MRKPRNLIIAGVTTLLALALIGCRPGEWIDVQSAESGDWVHTATVYQRHTETTKMSEEKCEEISNDQSYDKCLCHLECEVVPGTCETISTGVSDLQLIETGEPFDTGETTYFNPHFSPQPPDPTVLDPEVSMEDDRVSISTYSLENCSDVEDIDIPEVTAQPDETAEG